MKVRALGRTGDSVSAVGLGTAQIANVDGSAPNAKRIERSDAVRILETALDGGVTFFDTGDQYGAAEELLGAVRAARRPSALVATKAGLRSDGVRDFSARYLGDRVTRSLGRLKTDRLDLFQLNKPKAADWQDGALADFLAREKRAGRIRLAGAVVGDPEDGLAALRTGAVDCVQVLFHLLYQRSEAVIDEAARLGKGVIVRSPLNSGLLAGVHDETSTFSDERSRYFTAPLLAERMAVVRALQADLEVRSADLFQFAIRFCLSQPGVSTVIPGASTVEQLRRNMACGDLPSLEGPALARVKATLRERAAALQGQFQSP
ncbi:aldo/keto reductase [bacterium]|nr:MAG: aldo/keto reductase [bacterium]